MSTVYDVAEYILSKGGSMSAMKLQKLVYYSQAWHLVWDEEPLFDARVEAWANGPVVPALYNAHRGEFRIDPGFFARWNGNGKNLSESEKETVDSILRFYGDKGPQWLSDLTHAESPWKDARKGLEPGDRGNNEISHEAMAEYYGQL